MNQGSDISPRVFVRGVPVAFLLCSPGEVAARIGEIGDRTRIVAIAADGVGDRATVKVLAVADDYPGDIETAKDKVLKGEHVLCLFSPQDRPVSFFATLDQGMAYAAGDKEFRGIPGAGTERLFRALAEGIFDADGFVIGSGTRARSFALHPLGRSEQAGFTWNAGRFAHVWNEFGGIDARHAALGSRAVLLGQVGTRQLLVATAPALARRLSHNAPAFTRLCRILDPLSVLSNDVRRIDDQSFTASVTCGPDAYTFKITFDTDGMALCQLHGHRDVKPARAPRIEVSGLGREEIAFTQLDCGSNTPGLFPVSAPLPTV